MAEITGEFVAIHERVNDVLLGCIGMLSAEEKIARLEGVAPEEWQAVVQAARRHRVSPLLFDKLKALHGANVVPAKVLVSLREDYLGNAVRNLRLYRELHKIVTALHAEDIPVIVLKGAFLAELVYRGIASRTMGDLDLLVPRENLGEAVAILNSLGYQPRRSVDIDVALRFSHHLVACVRSGASAPVEIHWNLVRSRDDLTISPCEFWEHSLPETIGGVQVRVLCPEHLLLHLCHHIANHHVFELGLRPLCDIAETLRCYGKTLNWSVVLQRAQQWRSQRGVFLALRLARDCLSAPVPEAILSALCPANFDESHCTTAREQMLCPRSGEASHGVSSFFTCMWQERRLADKLGILARRVFLRKIELAYFYNIEPGSLRIYWYYLVRLHDLLRRYSASVFRLIRGERQFSAFIQRKSALFTWLAEE